MKRYKYLMVFGLLFLAACSGGIETVTLSSTNTAPPKDTASSVDTSSPKDTVPPTAERELEIITLLPKDGIPAIDNPVFVSAEEADLQYEPDELVIGVQFDGDARAYSIPLLSSHEIVNDTVGGRKIAVTW
jgi:hypothetical protein